MAEYDWKDGLELITNPLGFITKGLLGGSSKPKQTYKGMVSLPPSQKGRNTEPARLVSQQPSRLPLSGLARTAIGGNVANTNIAQSQIDFDRQKELYEDIYAKKQPWNVQTDLGSVDFDPESRQITSSMNDTQRGLFDQALARAASTAEQISTNDPWQMQQNFYNQQLDMARPEQDRARDRQFALNEARGLADATVGHDSMRPVEEAIAKQNAGMLFNSFPMAQQYHDNLRSREAGDIGMAMNFAGQPSGYIDYGRTTGQGSGIGNIAGVSQGSSYLSAAHANKATQRGNSLWDMLGLGGSGGGMFGDWLGDLFD